MPKVSSKQSQWRLFLKFARLIANAQQDPQFNGESPVALEIYREALALTRQGLPVVEQKLQYHGLLPHSDGPSASAGRSSDGNGMKSVGGKKGLLSLVGKVAKMGFGGAKKGKGGDGGGKWRAVLTKEMHEVIVMFLEDAEKEVEKLERLLEGKGGRSGHRRAGREENEVGDDGDGGRHVHFGDDRSVWSYGSGSSEVSTKGKEGRSIYEYDSVRSSRTGSRGSVWESGRSNMQLEGGHPNVVYPQRPEAALRDTEQYARTHGSNGRDPEPPPASRTKKSGPRRSTQPSSHEHDRSQQQPDPLPPPPAGVNYAPDLEAARQQLQSARRTKKRHLRAQSKTPSAGIPMNAGAVRQTTLGPDEKPHVESLAGSMHSRPSARPQSIRLGSNATPKSSASTVRPYAEGAQSAYYLPPKAPEPPYPTGRVGQQDQFTGDGGTSKPHSRTFKDSRPSSKTSNRGSSQNAHPQAGQWSPGQGTPAPDVYNSGNEQIPMPSPPSKTGSKSAQTQSKASSRMTTKPQTPGTERSASSPHAQPAFANTPQPVDPLIWSFPEAHAPAPSKRSTSSHRVGSHGGPQRVRSTAAPSVASQASNVHAQPIAPGSAQSPGSARAPSVAAGAAPEANNHDLFSDVSSISYQGFKRQPRQR
ncbi:hypothetical protein LTR85_006452 [Meristemomyces frigidus]|nr:hypothetical protein LTR85_006452 [Meristemomyces frigidus]